MSYTDFDFPHTSLYTSDLREVIANIRKLEDIVKTFVNTESLKFANPITWNITTQYEKSTVVIDTSGNAYLSLQPVPAGIQLNNDEYWLEIFNFTDYTRTANQNLTVNVETNTTRATSAYQIDDWLIWNDVLYKVTSAISIDDLLVIGTNIVHFTVENFIKAFMTWATNTIQQYKNDIDASELAYRNQLAQDITDTTTSLQAQLDAAIAGATVDSEVINARVGWDNHTYNTLGDAIREQFSTQINRKFTNKLSWVDAFRGYYIRKGSTFVLETSGDFTSAVATVSANDVIYLSAPTSVSLRVAFFDSNMTPIDETTYSRIITVPNNANIAYMGVPVASKNIGLFAAYTSDIPARVMTKFTPDGVQIESYYNFFNNNDSFANFIKSKMKFTTKKNLLLKAFPEVGHSCDSVTFKCGNDSDVTHFVGAYFDHVKKLTILARVGFIALALNKTSAICISKDGKIYRLSMYDGSNSVLDTIAGLANYNFVGCPLTITNNGDWTYTIQHVGQNDSMILDMSSYVSQSHKKVIGMVVPANTSSYINNWSVVFGIYAYDTLFEEEDEIIVPTYSAFTNCQRALGLRMLADAQGCYYIPFNALGLGVSRDNGTYGNDYIADQIHPTALGGYNIACGVWSYLKNIPCWNTSIGGTPVLDGSQWNGKKWYAYGTSLTKESDGKFVNHVASFSGMTAVNKGIGGGALVTNRQIYNALRDMTDGKLTADLLTIEVGANDMGPLGDPYSLDTMTFFGALNNCIKYMFDNGLQAQVVIMCSYPARYQVGDPTNTYDVDHLINA